ncbi:hypothetical protein Dimus_013289 [Dionaea muscipula]
MQTPSLEEKPSGYAWELGIELTILVSMKPPFLGIPSSRMGDCRTQDPHFPMNTPTTAQSRALEWPSLGQMAELLECRTRPYMSKYSRRSQHHAEQEAISELTSSWNNTTVAAADHEEEGRGEHTPWPSLSSAKLLISDEQLKGAAFQPSR